MRHQKNFKIVLYLFLLTFIFSLSLVFSQNVKYSISGKIKDKSGVGISDVTVVLGGSRGGRTNTDASGSYKFDSLLGGRFYTVTPAKQKYTFDPKFILIDNLSENRNSIDFTGTALSMLNISGYIKDMSQKPIPGVILALLGGRGGKATTDNNGFYKIDSLESGRYYVLTPFKKSYTFDPYFAKFDAMSESKTQNFTAIAAELYSISGYVQDKDKIAINEVLMVLVGEKKYSVMTDSKGFYKFDSLEAEKTYNLSPFKKRYTFEPRDMKFEKLKKNEVQDFKGTLAPYLTISGIVKDKNSAGIAGVTLGILGGKNAKVTTDNSGAYKFDSLNPGFYYLIIPSKRGYTFDPSEKSFENLMTSKTQDFTGTATATYSVSGVITDNTSKPLPGVTVKLVGDKPKSVLTDNSGAYKFDSLEGKRPVIIFPEKRGYLFNPRNAVFPTLTENKTQNFVGTGVTFYSISGMVKDSNNEVISGVSLVLGGERHRVIKVDSISGFYRFDSLESGKSFIVFPVKRGYKFEPKVKQFDKLSANASQDFIGTRLTNENSSSISGVINSTSGGSLNKSTQDVFLSAGITVYLMGDQQMQTTTDKNGFYTFEDLEPGQTYSITPSLPGITFYPPSQTIISDDENQPEDIISTSVVTTGVPATESLPSEFELYNNYPNPFNPATVISFHIPVQSHIRLDIFDILGKKIATLVNENKKPGKYSVFFDAKNLSSGVYFYSLKMNDIIKTKSMMFMK